ncbi:uncharacterized protein ASPGLDRAFT_40832 [Aspergillus glaucus CBS 516.65]|uniref:Uncharacterized protein n=1 Tax=Aspergillus glaucus CBS 516.65 TaxID=1160497 RepID=A0A1L9V385_ASPGL|nr:hypothetical protein ASPGLDRAFT_40832 [Aspergillus glaucus CBS 516.65]OJJ78404.1 hypothetical protein ASPGLDRAFT_40832 [Aspergillus glaucus CBS 516.65]
MKDTQVTIREKPGCDIELENLEIELQQKKANLKKQEDIHLQQLQNEKLELDLMERRMRIQEHE